MKYMWPCAWACTTRRHQWLWDRIVENCPNAVPYLEAEHKQIWSSAKFSGECKVDYVNNNILKRDVVSPLLNLLLNYHHHFLPNLGKLHVFANMVSFFSHTQNDLITLLFCSKRKGGCGTSKCKNASKKSKKNATGTSTCEPPTELVVEPG